MSQTASVDSLQIEHRADTLGLGTARPRLSWTISTDAADWRQTGYEVEYSPAGGQAHTARVDSTEQVLVPWPFEPLTSRERGTLRVRALGSAGQTELSEPVALEAGLLDPADWQARFITPAGGGGHEDPAPIVFSDTELSGEVASARLYVTALGLYRFSINGQRVGAEELAPGWTSYSHRLRYQTFDVTDLLQTGTNRLEAILGNGWYRGRLGWSDKFDLYGDRLGLLAQLEISYADGRTEVVGTDASWSSCPSGILFDDIYDGQRTDLRVPNTAGDAAAGVEVLDRDLSTLVAPEGPPVRITEVLAARSVDRSPSGKLLVDFGQNLVGWVRLKVSGQSGQEITIRHAEVLEHGELGVRPLRSAKATDTFVLSGAGEELLEPQFTFHGFRYVEVTGVDELTADQIEAAVLHSDLERTGWFESSDADLNQLHANVVWGMRGNFLDVPTDCPQRDERLGWTGDIQVFSPTASFLYDTAGFLSSWLKDLAVEQHPDGSVPFVIPDIIRSEAPAAAAWGDAATVVPWVLYERFGDMDVLRTQFASMKRWVDKISSLAGPDGVWAGGFQFGDWLDPIAPPDDPAAAQADPDVVATAHLVHSAQLVARTAELLGEDADAAHYSEIAARALAGFDAEYVSANGRVLSDCPTVYSLALVWSLLSDEQRSRAGERLATLVRKAGFRVSTGFVGTPLILDALSEVGEDELAYRLLLEKGCPSWLYPITMGATTIWERWDSMLPDGSINPGQMTSFNHYALGAVADWMHRRLAGLAPAAPGYRKITVRPIPGGGLTWAKASHRSPYGLVSVSWRRSDGRFNLDVTVPPGSTAEVFLPGSETPEQVGHGSHSWNVADRVEQEEPVETVRDVLDHKPLWDSVTQILIEHGVVDDAAQVAQQLGAVHDAPVEAISVIARREMQGGDIPDYLKKINNLLGIGSGEKESVR
ncbi:glycoside hydrolase family 78 protein [Microlunatus panaciterrae]|uniref:alpha-L-rhamnosidase n=1 Tax=Microlunatus panaciterrae TaxID=400768 RepID=A0ABS2RLJ1_9ACTN|nr:glycoside hydrolase family 78 protein [Microlunatus panaciterrae]MBM7799885.1 alpha-L-rhamnosidase [Microlunatus panaciterrae]